jgi:hypothetical protein
MTLWSGHIDWILSWRDPRVQIVVGVLAVQRVGIIFIWPHSLKNLLWLNGAIQLPLTKGERPLFLLMSSGCS